MKTIERRVVAGAQVRAKNDTPGIEGYAAVFDAPFDSGYFIETIAPGAFSRALTEKQDVRCLFNHDANNLLGRTKSGTLLMQADDHGLHYTCDVNPKTRVGADVLAMVERCDLDGCSFSFSANEQEWREEKSADGSVVQYRTILDLDLYDVGPVTYPAYTTTSVGMRSLWPNGVPEEVGSHIPGLRSETWGTPLLEMRADRKTKRVDGEDLDADAFLIVLDPEETDTWKLPWKFSTEEKTVSHLRNALARFGQIDDVPADVKAKAWRRLLKLAADHGIDVSDEDAEKVPGRSADPTQEQTETSNDVLERLRMRQRLAEVS